MAGETNQLSGHFSSHGPVEQVSASPWTKCLISSYKILEFKRKMNVWKSHVVKVNLEMFLLLLGLESEEEYQQVLSLIEIHLEELQNKIKHYSPLLSTQMHDWVRNPDLKHLLGLRT
jgi:hypothetical protein